MKSESRRLASFAGWSVPFIRPADLAKAGFYSVNQRDNCRFLVYIVFLGGNPVVMFLSLSEFYKIPLISNVIYVNIYSTSTILSIPISRIPGVLSATTLWGTGRRATCPWRSTLSSFPCVALSVACPSAIFPLKVRGNYIRILNHL